MGKVTVKHYLNTRVQLLVEESFDKHLHNHFKDRYPVYIQITYNRRTTQLKSFTSDYMTKEEFDYYSKGEFEKISKKNVFRLAELIKEPILVQKSIEYILQYWRVEKIDDLKSHIEFFIAPVNKGLIEMCWLYIFTRPQTNKEAKAKESFYKCFNKDILLTECLKEIEKISGHNIEPFIPKDDLDVWKDLDILLKAYKKQNYSLIDFVCNYKECILKVSKISNKERFANDIKEMIKIDMGWTDID